ncbi:MAG: hypothetical protein LBS97_01295, partial [Treponema sp.]|nr:hypothetical protein [Treponema sp.]
MKRNFLSCLTVLTVFIVLTVIATFTACDTGSSPSNQSEPPPQETPFYIIPFVDSATPYTGQAIRQVAFAEGETSKTVTIAGLAGQSVFLVKMNKSIETVVLEDTGGILPTVNNADLSARSARLPGFPAGDVHRHGTLPALSQRT